MFNRMYRFSSPKWFYSFSERFSRVFGYFAFFALSLGLVFALVISPPDYQQGESVRIMYVHVPSALFSMSCFAFMGVFSLFLLVWRVKLAGLFIKSLAVIGLGMTLLALITGSLWGKPMWGSWWVWDARLTAEFILALLYLATLALEGSFKQRHIADKAMAIMSLIGLIDLPIIHYSVQWWHTLHQGPTILKWGTPAIAPSMLWPLLWMFAAFTAFSIAWVSLRFREGLLHRHAGARWVAALRAV